MATTFSPLNPRAITKRNLLAFFGRWGETKEAAMLHFGVTDKAGKVVNEKYAFRLLAIVSNLAKKRHIGEDKGLIYRTVNPPVEA